MLLGNKILTTFEETLQRNRIQENVFFLPQTSL